VHVRDWWDNTRLCDQVAVLRRLRLDPELANVPWAFLPEAVKHVLTRRVQIDEQLLEANWRRE
jgi:hypothetical protein